MSVLKIATQVKDLSNLCGSCVVTMGVDLVIFYLSVWRRVDQYADRHFNKSVNELGEDLSAPVCQYEKYVTGPLLVS